MKAFIAFLFFTVLNYSICIPIEETEDYKKSKIEYDALIKKLNATDPCQLNFKCNDREECVNFPKCKTGESCPRTKCVPRKLCQSAICPPGTECVEYGSPFGDFTEHEYGFLPPINFIGNTRGIRPHCVSRKVPSDGKMCGVNEVLNEHDRRSFSPLGMSESTCSIGNGYGLLQTSYSKPYVDYCVCKKDFVRDDINGECIHYSKCPNFKSTKSPKPFETEKTVKIRKSDAPKVKDSGKTTKLPINALLPNRSKFLRFKTAEKVAASTETPKRKFTLKHKIFTKNPNIYATEN